MSQRLGAQARFDAVREIHTRTVRHFNRPVDDKGVDQKVSSYYGVNTFGLKSMKERLPGDVFKKIQSTIETGSKLAPEVADTVAQAVKDWAISRGVTHFCHWFQPMTGDTAEKHDAFLSLDGKQNPLEKFSGAQLIQSEPDASSFPSGGMRTTFEARGYTAWDPSSPMFIVETTNTRTLCIPSAFISYTGHSLDKKTALLRSNEVLSKKACELLHLMGVKNARRVVATLGTEQEYFLVDRAFFNLRPDLVMSGRTLLGERPPRGQQMEDHYFGSIPSRVQAFMGELELELFKLGVPIKTRHNEVAPSQFESAPIFEEANVAVDHNQLVMEYMRKVAQRHGFAALLHEKPFQGINGSGKHNNWSMMITASGEELDGENLLEPSKSPAENVRFLAFLTAVTKGVHKHAALLRAGIASAGNDHRLGANEAPPAIISVFLGETLSRILDQIGDVGKSSERGERKNLALGVAQLPEVLMDNTDRNRTSPFAFTGNKFEFRAVGSSASPALPVTFLNAAVSDGLDEMITRIKSELKTESNVEQAVLTVVAQFARETKAIRFDGNNYSEEWVVEAEKRGLPNLRRTPEALAQMVAPGALELLQKFEILSHQEMESRYHVRLERYIKNVLIEVDTLKSMINTQILPACLGYQRDLARGVIALKEAGLKAPQTDLLKKVSVLVEALHTQCTHLETLAEKVDGLSSEPQKAEWLANKIVPAMQEARGTSDQLEGLVGDDYWPLPKYREMLFLGR